MLGVATVGFCLVKKLTRWFWLQWSVYRGSSNSEPFLVYYEDQNVIKFNVNLVSRQSLCTRVSVQICICMSLGTEGSVITCTAAEAKCTTITMPHFERRHRHRHQHQVCGCHKVNLNCLFPPTGFAVATVPTLPLQNYVYHFVHEYIRPDANSTLAIAAARVTCHSCCSCLSHVTPAAAASATLKRNARERKPALIITFSNYPRHSGTRPNLSDLAAVVQTLQQQDALFNLQQQRDANNNVQALVIMTVTTRKLAKS